MTELELELLDLSAHLDMPPAPSLAGTVVARLDRRRRGRRLFVVAVATGVAALAVALAVPESRAAILRFFHIRGTVVTIVDRLPPLTTHRSLGVPVALGETSFRLLLPSGRRPQQVYAQHDGGYWLRYRGLLVYEFESGSGSEILKKAAVGATDIRYVRVGAEPGIWIGGHHAVYLPGGPPFASGHALIWQHGPLTLRLEASVGRERALAIARRIH